LRAVWRYPFSSKRRERYRSSKIQTFSHAGSAQKSDPPLHFLNLKAIWRYPFSSERRKLYRASKTSTIFDRKTLKREILFVPLYVDPSLDRSAAAYVANLSIAVHLHLPNVTAINAFSDRMAAFVGEFDLFISLDESNSATAVESHFSHALPSASKIVVKTDCQSEYSIVPFVAQFGEQLSKYDIVGHFFLKSNAADEESPLLDLLIGPVGASSNYLALILQHLTEDAKLIYPEGTAYPVRDASFSSMHKHTLVASLLSNHPDVSLESAPVIYSPNGSMFWARGDALQADFELPTSFASNALSLPLLDDKLGYALVEYIVSLNKIR
jgi:lipopolysaccharide biosynthesis protein